MSEHDSTAVKALRGLLSEYKSLRAGSAAIAAVGEAIRRVEVAEARERWIRDDELRARAER